MARNPSTFLLVCIFFFGFAYCLALIKIQINEKTTVEWSDCIMKKFVIYPKENTTCSDCMLNGEKLEKFDIQLYQNFKNCTESCPRRTICTEYKYNIGGVFRSECYQCDVGKKEEECRQCAKNADLSTAISCTFKCKGKPTFCYPTEMWFGHYKCYQANKMYGCIYTKVLNPEKTSCFDCALAAVKSDAQQCASECDGIPTYHTVDEFGKTAIFQCQLGAYHEVFEYNIPPEILNFVKAKVQLGPSKLNPSL